MKLRLATTFCCLALACGARAQPGTGTTTGGVAGATSVGATTTSGPTTGGTSGAATSSGGASGSTGTSSSSTGGSMACAPNAIWLGETCVAQSCPAASDALCALIDGGVGTCSQGKCLDVAHDSINCGAAGILCPAGATCQQGTCTLDGRGVCASGQPNPCPPGLSCEAHGRGCVVDVCTSAPDGVGCTGAGLSECCGQTCRAVESDPQNCGGCGLACGSGAGCLAGDCVAACGTDNNVACAVNGVLGFCCGGACIEEASNNDDQNCGQCGLACSSGYSCSMGSCGGIGSVPPCSGSQISVPPACFETTCALGQQGSLCAVATSDFAAAVGICCGTTCTVIRDDALNCNGCGRSCPAGAACIDGVCAQPPQCSTAAEGGLCLLTAGDSGGVGSAPTYPDGGIGMCCDGQCIDPRLDDENCSHCGAHCPLGSHCQQIVNGLDLCVQGGGLALCNLGCDAGQTCSRSVCYLDSCADQVDGTDCGFDGTFPEKCCGGTCVDVGTSNTSCGKCGLACPVGGACDTSACVDDCAAPQAPACPVGTVCTPGTGCLPFVCGPSSNGDICAFGAMAGTCCNQLCVNLAANPDNCGRCGEPCDGICNQGLCESLLSSSCLQTCGAQTLCVDGACVGSVCAGTDRGYCLARDGEPGHCCNDGACADLLTDSANCGACGLACPDGGGCSAGICAGSTCGAFNAGKYCGNDLNHECCGVACADLSSDASNCGQCGTSCGSGVCSGGTCG